MIELCACWPLEIIRLGVRGQGWPWVTPPVLQSATSQVTAPNRLHCNISFMLEINTARCPVPVSHTKAPLSFEALIAPAPCGCASAWHFSPWAGRWNATAQSMNQSVTWHLNLLFLWLSCGGYRGNAEGKGHRRVKTRYACTGTNQTHDEYLDNLKSREKKTKNSSIQRIVVYWCAINKQLACM